MMIARLIFILCHISCAAATVGVAHSLDSKLIQSLVYDSLESWLVLYHGAGQDVEPLLKEVAAKISIYGISVGSIDCSKEQKLCNADGIRQHPTAKLMTEKPVFNPYTKKMYRNGEPFVSEILDMKSLEKYIAKSFPSAAIFKVTSEAEFKSNDKIVSTLPTAVLFTEKSVPSLLYRTIALRLKGAMNFVYIPIKASTDLIFKSSTDEMTSAIIGILEPNSDSIQKYTGDDVSSREDVLKWLLSFIPEDHSTVTDTPNTSNSQNNNEANKYSSSDFTVDTLSSDIAWIVAVVNQNEKMPAIWSEAKKGCQGSIQSAVITCDKKDDDSSSTLSLGQQACKQKDIPYFLTFKHGVAERKKLSNPKFKIESIMSDFESHVEVVRSLGDSLPTSTVKAVYENSLPQFVMDGIGKGLLSIILLTDGTEPSTLFKNVALTYAQNAQFGLITGPSEDMMKRSGITKLPCVIALTPEELSPEIQKNQKDQKGKKGQQEQGLGMRVIRYDHQALGPVRFQSLSTFVLVIQKQANLDTFASIQQEAANEALFDNKDIVVLPIRTEEDWSLQCGENFRGICMLGLFTPTADSVDALQGSEMLQSAINSMGKNAATFRFLSVDAKCQQEFVQYFGIQDHEVPTVVIYSPSKRRYQLLKGSFTETSIKDFAQSIVTGRTTTVPMSMRPVISSECSPSMDLGSGQEESAESSEDAEEFLKEIRREEEAKAAQAKLEIKEEQLRLLEESKKAAAKPKSGKKKKKKSAKAKKSEL